MLIQFSSSFFRFEFEIFPPYEVVVFEVQGEEPVKIAEFYTLSGAISYAKKVTSEWAEQDQSEFDWFVQRVGKVVDCGSATIKLIRVVEQGSLRIR